MKEWFRIKAKWAIRTLWYSPSCHILTCREGVVVVADGKIVKFNVFQGRWDWASDQIEFTDDNEYLITFEKEKPWDVRWCCSLSSWLERKSLRTSLVDLYTSYWILVWKLDDFQRSFEKSLGDSFNELRRTVCHWVNSIEGGQISRPNLLRYRKTLLSEMFRFPGFGYISYSEIPGQFR